MTTEQNTSPAPAAEVEQFILPPKELQSEHYELMVLIPGQLLEDEARTVWDEIKQLIQANSGQITTEQELGRKDLAYTVAGSRNGTYFVLECDLPKPQLAVIQEKLRIRKEVARVLFTKKRVKSAEEIAEEKRVNDKIQARKQQKAIASMTSSPAPAVVESPRPAAPVVASVPSSAPAATEEPAPKKPTSSLADLDREIEKLLSDNIDV